MNKTVSKLIIAVLALILAVSIAVMSTYAWMILSKNPAAEGIQITIGGGNTILIAPNVTETVNGVSYNYPGAFSERLNFSQADNYDYLQELGGLSPVSTSNGLDWFVSGPGGYTVDDTLNCANQNRNSADLAEGHYVYLDFWVVSPGADYTLRVSSDGGTGSFAIDLPQPAEDGEGGYTLAFQAKGSAAASVRVGFLVDDVAIVDDTMVYYQRSPDGSGQYTRLKGVFGSDRQNYSFYIYEPNGDYHPNEEVAQDGSYVITQPLGLVDSQIVPVDVAEQLSVQLKNWWTGTESGGYQLEQRFQAAIAGKNLSGSQLVEIRDLFYREYLQQQVSSYVTAAKFVKSTQTLYRTATAGMVDEATLSEMTLSGATEDTYIIQLENGHYIVHDGGQTANDYEKFVTYLKSLEGDGKPVIDAWIISHGHVDHYGILNYIDLDENGICDDFCVEGIYFTEPSMATRKITKTETSFDKEIRNSVKLLRTSKNDVTCICDDEEEVRLVLKAFNELSKL